MPANEARVGIYFDLPNLPQILDQIGGLKDTLANMGGRTGAPSNPDAGTGQPLYEGAIQRQGLEPYATPQGTQAAAPTGAGGGTTFSTGGTFLSSQQNP